MMMNLHIPALVLIAVAAPLSVTLHSDAKAPRPETVTFETRHTGHITGWRIDEHGRVYFRLKGIDKHKRAFELWYVTPPSQTSTTEFERLVLPAVLDLYRSTAAGQPEKITVRGDDSNDRGRSPEDAIDLLSIARL